MRYGWLVAVLVLAGCAGGSGTETLFDDVQSAVVSVAGNVKPSLAYIEIRNASSSSPSSSYYSRRGSSSTKKTGVILTSEGHTLVDGALNLEKIERIRAWVGDVEYKARALKKDDQIGKTIVKIEADTPLMPMSIAMPSNLERGEWCVAVTPSGEDTDFEIYTDIAYMRGEKAGRFRRFMLGGNPQSSYGSPVLSLDGELVGFSAGKEVVALADVVEDINSLLNESKGGAEEDDEKKKKGWFGATFMAVNKDYARLKSLPRSGIWLTHVFKDSPAEKSGLRSGDLVTTINGREMRFTGSRALMFFSECLRPRADKPFSLTVLRDGTTVECAGTYIKKPEPETFKADDFGVDVRSFNETDIIGRNLFTDKGVLVTNIRRGSPAATSSSFGRPLLRMGDVITELGGMPTTTIEEFGDAVEKVRGDKASAVLVKYVRGRAGGYAGLNLKIGEEGAGGSK